MINPSPLLRTLLNKRLLIVTGKGGVGKSAVAAALAHAAAANGRRTLLASYSRIDEPHPFFGIHMPYQPTPVVDGLHVCRIEAHEALKEYVHRTLPLGNLYDWFLDSRALAHFTEAAPGFDELMCLGKVYDHVEGSDAFDLVVLDAPATGHAALMLGVPAVTGRAVGTGPLHHNALKIQLLLESARTEVVLVALAEEMALREADEMSHRIKTEFNMSVGALVLNRITTSLFDDDEVAALTRLAPTSAALARMIDAARDRHALASLQQRYESEFSHADPRLRVPHVIQQHFDGRALVAQIADHLAASA
jgi:anion-transporting  ArsA/GET3 family ATPase